MVFNYGTIGIVPVDLVVLVEETYNSFFHDRRLMFCLYALHYLLNQYPLHLMRKFHLFSFQYSNQSTKLKI